MKVAERWKHLATLGAEIPCRSMTLLAADNEPPERDRFGSGLWLSVVTPVIKSRRARMPLVCLFETLDPFAKPKECPSHVRAIVGRPRKH
jgi:hypothetical protein